MGDSLGVQVNAKGKEQQTYDAIVIGSGISGGWAAKELTTIEHRDGASTVSLRVPYACDEFTLSVASTPGVPTVVRGESRAELTEVDARLKLRPGTWCREKESTLVCFALAKGRSELVFKN